MPLQSVTDCEAKDMLRRRGMLPLACFVYFFAIYFKKLMTQPRTFLAQEEPFRAPGPCPVYFSGLELPVLGARTRRGREGWEAGWKINKSAGCTSHFSYITTSL